MTQSNDLTLKLFTIYVAFKIGSIVVDHKTPPPHVAYLSCHGCVAINMRDCLRVPCSAPKLDVIISCCDTLCREIFEYPGSTLNMNT